MRDRSSRSSTIREKRVASAPSGEPGDHVWVLLAVESFCQKAQRPQGRLQLMAQIGHEVAPYGLQPAQFGNVFDQRHRAHGLAFSPQGKGPDLQGVPSGGVEVERLFVVRARERSAQGRLYRFVGQ